MSKDIINIGIFGAGLSGKAIGTVFAKRGKNGKVFAKQNKHAKIWGTTRSKDNFTKLTNANIEPVLFNAKQDILQNKLKTTTHLIISIAPTDTGDIILPILQNIALPNLTWVCYLSTVGVYGNHDGKWVDEKTRCSPLSVRSKNRLKVELAWQEWAGKKNLPLAIYRLSGIYGLGRNALQNAKQGKARRLIKKGQVFNRIHADDIGMAVLLGGQKKASGIFNITDDEPCPPQDVVLYAHKLLGLTPPPKQDFATANISPMARSFYGENKRVSNKKSKTILGLEYKFPNYKVALNYMLQHNCW